MSLAMYAAPFDNDINQINMNSSNNENLNGRKKITNNNKTIKKYPKDNEKINSVLQTIQNLPSSQDDGNYLGDFSPLPPPTSVGVENTRINERQDQQKTEQHKGIENDQLNFGSKINSNTNLDNGYPVEPQYQTNQSSYRMPNYASTYKNNESDPNDLLIQKLNYMINLLEQNQDERTNNVTEEIVLYSFLGIFIIFIVDSFVRVGKYVR